MISRAADHCFWFGRYLERAECTARLIQVTTSLALDGELTPEQCWRPLIVAAGEQERFPELCGAAALADGDVVQNYLTFEPRVAVSLLRSVAAARDNARSVREIVSLEAWETINELHLYLASPIARADYEEHRYGFYRRVRREAQLCLGFLRATMLHDTPLYFCWLGVLLERVNQTARILDVHHHAFSERPEHPVLEVSIWLSLLRACYGFEPFMKTHRGAVTPQAVASFLVFEKRFPRAVRHGLRRVREVISWLRPGASGLASIARLDSLESWLDQRGESAVEASRIHETLTHVVDETQAICDVVQSELIAVDSVVQAQSQSQS